MAQHPVDEEGRVLPEPWWPPERAAPGGLELVRRFCNSLNRENGADRFAQARSFDDWLASEGRPRTNPTSDDLDIVAAAREAIHDITLGNQTGAPAPGAWSALAEALTGTTCRLVATSDRLALSASSPSATLAFLVELALTCMRARDEGTMQRLKSCAHCEWTIYDASKNQSGRWCSASACGGRHNARSYRRRRRQP